jgi:hypothetical protein
MKGQLRLVIDENFEWLQGMSRARIRLVEEPHTLAINFLHVTRMSFANVALNIITCL